MNSHTHVAKSVFSLVHLSFVSLIHMPPVIQPNRVEGKLFLTEISRRECGLETRHPSSRLRPHLQPPPRSACGIHKSPRRALREPTRGSRKRKGCFGLCLTCSDFIFSSKVPAQRGHSLSSELIYLFHPEPFTHPAAAAKLLQLCPTLCDPIDGSPPGSPVPGILQARTLEWVAISFSNA